MVSLLKLVTTIGIDGIPGGKTTRAKGKRVRGAAAAAAAAAGAAVSPREALRECVEGLQAFSPRVQRSVDKLKALVGL